MESLLSISLTGRSVHACALVRCSGGFHYRESFINGGSTVYSSTLNAITCTDNSLLGTQLHDFLLQTFMGAICHLQQPVFTTLRERKAGGLPSTLYPKCRVDERTPQFHSATSSQF